MVNNFDFSSVHKILDKKHVEDDFALYLYTNRDPKDIHQEISEYNDFVRSCDLAGRFVVLVLDGKPKSPIFEQLAHFVVNEKGEITKNFCYHESDEEFQNIKKIIQKKHEEFSKKYISNTSIKPIGIDN